MLLPVDPVYLTVLALPSGGAQSDFILLFTVQLISVTLLASPRAGIRLALWDSVLLLSVTLFQLGGPLGQALGTPQVVTPTAGAVGLRIGGFWAVALTTASFSALSELELRRSKAHLDALSTMAAQMEEAMESGCEPRGDRGHPAEGGPLPVRLQTGCRYMGKEGPGPGGTLCQRGRRRH